MKPLILACCILLQPLIGAPVDKSHNELSVEYVNIPLARVNNTLITLNDVVCKIQLHLHSIDKTMSFDTPTLYQAYSQLWRQKFNEIIENALVSAYGESLGVKIPDGTINEFMETMYGREIYDTLHKCDIALATAHSIVRNDYLAQGLMRPYVTLPAIDSVSPGDIKEKYSEYTSQFTPKTIYSYDVFSIRSNEKTDSEAVKSLACLCSTFCQDNVDHDGALEMLKEKAPPSIKITHSTHSAQNETQLSTSFLAALSQLSVGESSQPVELSSKSDSSVFKVFTLTHKIDTRPTSYSSFVETETDKEMSTALTEKKNAFIASLKEKFHFSDDDIYFPKNFKPFSLVSNK